MSKHDTDEDKLPPHWEKVHGAIWLVGLAILFWMGDIFPGVLVLAALSALVQAGLTLYVRRKQQNETLATTRELHLPETCPNCGGPIHANSVRWTGRQSAICPYCGSTIKATVKANP